MKTITADLHKWNTFQIHPDQVVVWWLGQAGFLFHTQNINFLVDPYLSDSLSVKYKGKKFKHTRMMPIPIEPSHLKGIDWIFCTHQHTDHMDIGTIPILVNSNPNIKLIAPRAVSEHVFNVIGMDPNKTTLVNPRDHIQLSPSISVDVIASAHEDLQFDDEDNSFFLGFIFTIDGIKIYHSGDCTPYDDLADSITNFEIDIAMLPVNGRDAYRHSNGVPGNFHFEEAVELCRQANIKYLIPHHFGMFDFNTVKPEVLKQKIITVKSDLNILLPEMNKAFVFALG